MKLKSYIDRLSFMELFIINITIFYLIGHLLTLALNYFFNFDDFDYGVLASCTKEHFYEVGEETINKNIESKQAILIKQANEINEISEEFQKIELDKEDTTTSFIGSAFLVDFESLDAMGKLAIALLFFNHAVISSLITIVIIFYGNYLIEKFNLEIKYPKLAEIIKLRRKFQQYYLFISILTILIIALIEIIFCISVLTS